MKIKPVAPEYTMMRALITYISCILLSIAVLPKAWAQQGDCGQSLARAQQLYDEGKLHQVPMILSKCLKSGFTQEEKIKAYRILTLTYLFTNDLIQADEVFAKLLRLSPDFTVEEGTDPAALVQLYQSYRTSPVFSVSLSFGPNQTYVRRSQVHGLTNTTSEAGDYSTKMGFQVGVAANIYLNKRVSIQAQATSTSRFFVFNNQLLGYSNVSYTEKQQLVEVPISAFYHFGRKKILPYVFVGGKYQHLIRSQATIVRQQNIGGDVEVNDLEVTSLRRNKNIALNFGAGVQYRIKRTGLFLQASFNSGIFEQVMADKRYSINSLAYQYGYVDDDFAIDNVEIQVGVTYAIYNPKKLKNKRFEALKEATVLINQPTNP